MGIHINKVVIPYISDIAFMQIELLHEHADYRCCPADEVEKTDDI